MTHDGYVRMPAIEFRSLNLELLDAAIDLEFESHLKKSGLAVDAAGYAEWIAHWSSQSITLGWDWFMLPSDPLPLIAPGDIGANVMLLGQGGYDLGPETSQAIMQQSLQFMPWRDLLVRHVFADSIDVLPKSIFAVAAQPVNLRSY